MGHAMLAFIGGIIGVALVILSVLIMVPVLAFSRIKEHLADLVAVEKFRDDSVIRALEKIEGYMVHTDFRLSKPSLKTMLYILPGFAEDIGISKLLKSVYSTHPPISARACTYVDADSLSYLIDELSFYFFNDLVSHARDGSCRVR